MPNLAKFIKGLMFKLALFHRGIRFYQTSMVPKSPRFKSAQFETVGDHQVEFFFYREQCEDLIFKRGRIRRETFIGYVIQAEFDDRLPEKLRQFNNLKFFFNSKDFLIRDEDVVASNLLAIYLDFLRSELQQQ